MILCLSEAALKIAFIGSVGLMGANGDPVADGGWRDCRKLIHPVDAPTGQTEMEESYDLASLRKRGGNPTDCRRG
jgi:hypothetical protein